MEAVKSFFRKYILVIKISRETVLRSLALLLLFLIAFIIRLYPILYGSGAFIRAYDPFIQYYAAKYIEEHGILAFLTSYHKQFWYPWGKYIGQSLYLGVPIVGALFHKLLLAIGIRVDLLTVVATVPAFFGALTVFPIYGIAKEVKGDKAALLAATFAGFSPGLLQRTITGFYDNESIGIFFTLMTMFFFIKGSKTDKSVLYSILAGLFLGLLTITWGLYRYTLMLLAVYMVILALAGKIDSEAIMSYVVTVVLALSIGALAPRNAGIITSTEVFVAIAVIALALLVQFLSSIAPTGSERREFIVKLSITGILFLSFVTAILLALDILTPIAGKFLRVMNPLLREVSPAFSSVSENQPASWGTIFVGVYLPIILVPIGVYYFIEDRSKESIFMLLASLTAIYFSASISRFIVVGAPLLAITAGIGADYLLEPFSRILRGEWFVHHIKPIKRVLGEQRLPKGEAVAVYALILLILLGSVNHMVWAAKGMTTYDTATYEKQAFDYLSTYASPTDVVLSWWDYGYRLSVLANVTTLADNATSNSTQMGVVGSMLMLPENESIKLMKKYNVKFVVVYTVDLFKAIWMIKIAEKYAPEFGVREADYYKSGPGGGYKEKFFHSVLWKLVMYKESPTTVQNWVNTIGEESVRNKYTNFVVSKLAYFKLVVNTRKDSRGFNVKVYEVIYRLDSSVYIKSNYVKNWEKNQLQDTNIKFFYEKNVEKNIGRKLYSSKGNNSWSISSNLSQASSKFLPIIT